MFGTETPFVILGAILVVGMIIGWSSMWKFISRRNEKKNTSS